MKDKAFDPQDYELPELVIRPSKGWVSLNLTDLWRYRELIFFLAWRDISVRYKQTILGVTWAIIQPLLMMIVFTIFFGQLGKIPSDGLPYPIFAYCALLPWQLFAYSLGESGNSLVTNQNLITKVYFPRGVIPLAANLGGLLDFLIATHPTGDDALLLHCPHRGLRGCGLSLRNLFCSKFSLTYSQMSIPRLALGIK